MGYDTKFYDDLYKEWLEQLKTIPNEELVEQVSSVMRSKLTSIIGSGQILTAELNDLDADTTDQQELMAAIVASARYISIVLDAAVDTAHKHTQEDNQQAPSRR